MCITKSTKNTIDARDEGSCVYCGGFTIPVETISKFRSYNSYDREYDHFIPKTSNGSDSVDNVVTSCLSCNQAKKEKTFLEFWFIYNEKRGLRPLKEIVQDLLDKGISVPSSVKFFLTIG